VAKELKARRQAARPQRMGGECQERKRTMQRRTHFDEAPIKPQRVYEEMNRPSAATPATSAPSACRRSPPRSSCTSTSRVTGSTAARPGPLGWTIPAALGVCAADPQRKVVAISGDYDFQFMIEELAVGAQFNLPYLHVVVNNSYLGLIRQAQRGFDMDYCVQLAFENINAPELNGYGVDHVAVVEGLGCKAIRVTNPTTSRTPSPWRSAGWPSTACRWWSRSSSSASPIRTSQRWAREHRRQSVNQEG
jgi:tartronate-semialdehyde synthase